MLVLVLKIMLKIFIFDRHGSLDYCRPSEHQLPICNSKSRAESLRKVCIQLPTGYIEYLCYVVLPFVVGYKLGRQDSLVLVVSPLVCPNKL